MAEATQITFTYKEVAECLVKKQGIHEGLWGVYINFGIQAANLGPSNQDIRPTAIVPIIDIGIQKFKEPSNITVDAAEVNPAPKKTTTTKKPSSK